jgi:hypothetical protein
MTRLARSKITCRLCAAVSRQTILLSSNTFGSVPGLDGRPGGMLRLTMKFWVQRCGACGYCAEDLSKDEFNDVPVLRVLRYDGSSATLEEPLLHGQPVWSDDRRAFLQSVVASKPYRTQLNNVFFPRLANSFWCSSLIAEAEHRYVAATFAALHAAWACEDDILRSSKADACRARVVRLIEMSRANGESFGRQLRSWPPILVDSLRRMRNFEAAASASREVLATEPDEFLRRLLQFQLELVSRADSSAQTLAQLERWSG